MSERCLLVLGMHRSGTSAITRSLNLLGMDVGSNLLAPNDVNARGFWEHADAVHINDDLLDAFGLLWHSLEPLPEGWLQSAAADNARARIRALIERDFKRVPLWGLKDPRMCRLAPIWIQVLQDLNIEVATVFTSRSPVEVALSLERAHGLQHPISVLMWVQHMAEAERATRGLPRVMTSYEDLLSRPKETLGRVAAELKIAWPMPLQDRLESIKASLDESLRSHRGSEGVEPLPCMVKRMLQACEGDGDWKALASLADEADEFFRMLQYRVASDSPDELKHKDLLKRQATPVYAELFQASGEQPFLAENAQRQRVNLGRNRIRWTLSPEDDQRYRLDPASQAGCFVIHAVMALGENEEIIWDWSEHADQVQMHDVEFSPRPTDPTQRLSRLGGDPQIIFEWSKDVQRKAVTLVLDIERFEAVAVGEELSALVHTVELERNVRDRERQVWEQDRHTWDVERDAWNAERSEYKQQLRKADDVRERLVAQQLQLDKQNELLHRQAHISSEMQRELIRQSLQSRVDSSRGLAARLRRRLLKVPLCLKPIADLEAVEGEPRVWRSVGVDPQFQCESDQFPLAPGWYLIDLRMIQRDGEPARPALYPDYGIDNQVDANGLPMHFVDAAQPRHNGLLYFAHTVFGLRFDPAAGPCTLSINTLSVRRVGRLRAGYLLLRKVAGHARKEMGAVRALRTFWNKLRDAGLRGVISRSYAVYAREDDATDPYEAWLAQYDNTDAEVLAEATASVAKWDYQPRVSLLVPTYNSERYWLQRCIESVMAQSYPHWQLCVADDASPSDEVMRVLNEYAERDARIRVKRREKNGHISAASNTALAMADGDYIALLDHDDELHPMALFEVVKAMQDHRSWKVIYTDEDKVDLQGRRYDPFMKPDWNYDLLLSQNYINHLGIYERKLVEDVGGFRKGYEGSQDWDLVLRCTERLRPEEIGHVPRVLYHWRAVPGSTATAVDEKSYAREAGKRAVQEHLQRIGANASASEVEGRPGNFHIRYALPNDKPKVSLLVPTRDGLDLLRQCLTSILEHTTYPNYEIVIVDNQSEKAETLEYFKEITRHPRVRVLAYDHPFNYSALNNYAAAHTDGEVIGLINNDIEVISPDWLEEMVGHAMRPEIGAVGAMLYYPNDTIQHAGVILGVGGVAAHAYCGHPRGYIGQMGRARLAQTLSAVTAACLLIRREVYDKVGGLNESLRVAFNDIDFCLRVRAAGYRNIWTPFAELYHHESATRGYEDSPEKKARFQSEVEYMVTAWGATLSTDPAYNKNLTLTGTQFDLAFPPNTLKIVGL